MLKKKLPIKTVAARKKLPRPRLPSWMAESDSTIVTDEQIRTNVLNAVKLMASGLTSMS